MREGEKEEGESEMEQLEKFAQTLGRVWREKTSFKKRLVSSFPLQPALTLSSLSLPSRLAPAERSVTFFEFPSEDHGGSFCARQMYFN